MNYACEGGGGEELMMVKVFRHPYIHLVPKTRDRSHQAPVSLVL